MQKIIREKAAIKRFVINVMMMMMRKMEEFPNKY